MKKKAYLKTVITRKISKLMIKVIRFFLLHIPTLLFKI